MAVLAFLAILNFGSVQGQGFSIQWKSIAGDCPAPDFKKGTIYPDTSSVYSAMSAWRQKQIANGYVDARIERSSWRSDTLYIDADCGSTFQWEEIRAGNVPPTYFDENRHPLNSRKISLFRPDDLPKLMSDILRQAENQGFPFAELNLDSIAIRESGLSGTLNFNTNQFIRFDSLIVKGDSKTNVRYIQNYLGLRKGESYDQSLYDKIPNRIRELAFIKPIKPYEIGFRPGKADIYVYITDRNASSFDGIIGIQPDGTTGKTIITGDVKLNLLNSFRRGERVNLRWQRLQTRTQQLDLAFSYPYILNTPLGFDFAFDLYRRDTLFSQIDLKVGVQYSLSGSNRLIAYYENNQANVISPQAVSFDFIDSQTNLFGVGVEWSDLDYRLNPSKGYSIKTDLAAGRKHIDNPAEMDDTTVPPLVENTDLYKGKADVSKFVPFAGRSTILLRGQGATIINENLFRNEIYRIGGLKTIRGFDEQSIFASSFMILTLEYRFILEENSNLFMFFDQGWYEDQSSFDYLTDSPSSFGAGINFETGAGIFALTYALGSQFNQGYELRSGKVHFGFTSYF